ncbi:hypothetical protein DDE05_21475 [Streptomyces cavourensis]|nr:hypothetical protein DDE05_21475 [Streptomyces cavourensis]
MCPACRGIIQNQRGAQGHAGLLSLGYVRSLAMARKGVTHEAFVCSACGAEWDDFHDKRDEAVGWSLS